MKKCLENITSMFLSAIESRTQVMKPKEKSKNLAVPPEELLDIKNSEELRNEKEMPKPIVIQMPLPNFRSGWPSPAEIAIIHYSSGYSVEDCYNTLLSRRLSVHESVERDGKIYQHLDHKNRGIHAGYGQWGGEGNMNSRAFGVEVINFGWGYEGSGSPSKFGKFGPSSSELVQDPNAVWYRVESYTKDREKVFTRVLTRQKMQRYSDHRKEHADKLWSAFTQAQVDSTHKVLWEWMNASPDIILENVIGHEHVTPHRKTDPGPAWPWRETEAFLEGMAKKERTELLDPSYKERDRIKAVQSHVHRCGPDIGRIDGVWGAKTMKGVRALIETYSDIYDLDLTTADIRKEKCLKLANAFRLIPGFDPQNR